MIILKKEDEVILSSLIQTQMADDRLSKYATKNSECMKVKVSLKNAYEFDMRWPFEEDIDRVLC